MKSISALLALTCAALATAAATPSALESRLNSLCGELGVMEIGAGDLPEGADPYEFRLCADHPLGTNRNLDEENGASLAPMGADGNGPPAGTTPAASSALTERACYYAAPYGCSDNYCWKSCGKSGEWCWTALNSGTSAWKRCASWRDCKKEDSCGVNCKRGSNSCGCSCH